MGILVEGQINSNESQRVVSIVASNTIVVGTGKIAIFVGSSIAHRQGEAVRRLIQCRDAAVETGIKSTPPLAAFITRSYDINAGKSGLFSNDGASVATLNETDVAVIWESSAVRIGSSLPLSVEVDVLINTLLEQVFKAT